MVRGVRQASLGREPEAPVVLLRELQQAVDVEGGRGVKVQRQAAVLVDDLGRQGADQRAPQLHDPEQVLHHLRVVAVAVADLVPELRQLPRVLQVGQTLVEQQPLVGAGHVVVGEVGGDAQADLGLHADPALFALQLVDGLFHHLGVELEAHRGDLAGLLPAQEVAGAADLQVVERQLEAAPQLVQLLQRPQPLLRVLGHGAAGGQQQVGVGAPR